MNGLWDNHMHSSFSGDCNASPEDMIAAAKQKKLSGITFTDHLDLDYLEEPGLFDLDIPVYFSAMQSLAKEHRTETFSILTGIELGLQPHLGNTYTNILKDYSFDYVIGSTHVIHGEDPYYPKYFSTRDCTTAFREYYEEVLENLLAFPKFDTLGHLDYCFRYGPYTSEHLDTYVPYQDIVDAILQEIIKRDIALEVNTGAFRCGMSEPNPSKTILKRYHEMGGKMITLGADAHKPEFVASAFTELPELLKECGFSSYVVFKERKPIEFPL